MPENVIVLDTTNLSNLAKSALFGGDNNLGLDLLSINPTERVVITPEIYFEAVTRNLGTAGDAEAQLIDDWITRNHNRIVNPSQLGTFDPTTVSSFDDLGDKSILSWLSENKSEFSGQILSDDNFFKRAEWAAGGTIEGASVGLFCGAE